MSLAGIVKGRGLKADFGTKQEGREGGGFGTHTLCPGSAPDLTGTPSYSGTRASLDSFSHLCFKIPL